jgi:class 3 adenylate cyclase/tetratricopeptide (TPR) repeat protein
MWARNDAAGGPSAGRIGAWRAGWPAAPPWFNVRCSRAMATEISSYAARLAASWTTRFGDSRHAAIDGTLASIDLSGFTRLGERLARSGRGGAEELNRVINEMWSGLVPGALDAGGDILQFGGDALLVLFSGDGHEGRAAGAALAMQRFIRDHGRVDTPAGPVRLRMSVGLHSDTHHLYVVGRTHRELLVAGPSATTTVRLESRAESGEVLVSDTVARALPAASTVACGDGAHRLRRAPDLSTDLSTKTDDESARGHAADLIARQAAGFVSHQVLEVVSAGTLPGEHRQVTVAFVKPAELDDIFVRRGPAAVLERLDAVAAAIDDAVERFDVCWLATDVAPESATFLLTAGAPRAGDADEERMLRAMRSVLGACPEAGLRVGVNRGRAFAAGVGHTKRRTYAVLGDTTNLAARLAARAAPGSIVASRAVLDRCAASFDVAPLDPFFVKGKRIPIEAGEVGPLVAGVARPALVSRDMVGRAEELATIVSAWKRATAGRGGAIEIVAEPGAGKSTLIDAALGPVQANGTPVFWMRGQLYEGLNAYVAVRDGFRDALGIGLEDSPDLAGADLLAVIDRVAPELAPFAPLIADVIGLTVAATDETRRLDPAHVQSRRHAVVVDLLNAVTHEPIVIGAEDLHWFDDASRELLRSVVDAANEHPWLIVATRRPGTDERGLDPGAATRLTLEPLDDGEATQLAMRAAGDYPIRDDVMARLVERAEGNPLFLEELVAAQRDGGDDGELPESIERVITTRIDRLRPADRTLLRQAAVLGDRVDLALLAEVLDDPTVTDAARWVDLVEFIDLAEGDGSVGGGAWSIRFDHDLVRLASYEGLAERRRRQIHGRVLDALERHAEPPVALLAMHAFAARRYTETWRWAIAAADRAEARSTFVEAAEQLERALAAAPSVPDLADELVAATAERLGDLFERLGRYDRAMAWYRKAQRSWHNDAVSVARCLRKRGRVAEKTGKYVQSLRYVGRGLTLLNMVSPSAATTEVRVELELTRALAWLWQGKSAKAADAARQGLALAESLVDGGRLRAQGHLQMEMALSDLGSSERAGHGAQAMALFELLGDEIGLGNSLLNVGVSEYNAGQWDLSFERYAYASAAYRRAGHVTASAHPINNQAEILTDQGRYAEAADKLRMARRIYRSTGYAMGVALTTSAQARLALRAGAFAEAHELLDEAMAEFERLGAGAYLLDTRVRRVETLVFERRGVEALESADDAIAVIDSQGGVPVLPITARRHRAVALYLCGRTSEAIEAIGDALAMARTERVPFEIVLCIGVALSFAEARDPTRRVAEIAERDETARMLGIVGLPALPVF